MSKRILCVNNGYPSERNPQYTTYIQSIARCLKNAGFSVDLHVIRFNRDITLLYKVLKYIQFWIKALYLNLKKYDIIYINHLPFVWTILFNPTLKYNKVYVHWHGNDLVSNTFFVRNILKLVEKKSKEFRHIVPSLYFKRILITKMGYSHDDIFISPSGGINIEIFKPKQRNSNDKIVIGYSSALMQSKGADVLVELIKRGTYIEEICNKKIAFKFINYGSESEFYVNECNSMGLDVNIIEKQPKERMPEFYQNIDILLMPSTSESLGLVVLEAMSCGVPVITYNLCAFPEFVVSGISGELVDYSDDFNERIDNYLQKIIEVIKNYDNYHPNDIIVDRYSEKSVIELYKTILRC